MYLDILDNACNFLLFCRAFGYDNQSLVYLRYIDLNVWFCVHFQSNFQIFLCKLLTTQWAFTGSKLTIETLEQGVKYVQS